jgi:pSer/pThr/pTyr-binding forkhead associated (FHA) protein
MGRVTFQVLDGLERGQVLRDLPTPVTIGREEENVIRLNDERVSRFHAKVQEQHGQYILTDLDSTNGTRVNGHPVHMHVLRVGDQVLVGRCLLLFGSPEELEQLDAQEDDVELRRTISQAESHKMTADVGLECPELFRGSPPPLPAQLNGVQTAQTADLLAYVHTSLLRALYSVQGTPNPADPLEEVTISAAAWHRLQRLQMDLATYLKQIAEPRD